jgi:anti-sigma B factor antagonist
MQLDLDKGPTPDSAVIAIRSGNLDARNAKDFKDSLQPLLEQHRIVVLDMSQLDFVDSSGLGALLSSLRVMNNKDGELRLCAMTKPVLALFELVRMHRLFSIFETREEALAAL